MWIFNKFLAYYIRKTAIKSLTIFETKQHTRNLI